MIPNPAFANRVYAAINESVVGVAGHPGTSRDVAGHAAVRSGTRVSPVPVATQCQDQRFAEMRDQPPMPIRGPVYHEVQMYGQAPRGTGNYVSLNGNQHTYSGVGNQAGAGNYASLDGNQRAYGSNSTA